MKLVFALHCETDWNDPAKRRLQGHIDTELNDYGRKRAGDLAKKLKEEEFKFFRIISSDLKRAKETAFIIGGILDVPVEIDNRLRECKFGFLEGLYKTELEKNYVPLRRDHPDLWHGSFFEYDFRTHGGEQRDDVIKRHLAVVEDVKQKYASETVLLIGHGMGLATLFAEWSLELFPRGEYKVVEV